MNLSENNILIAGIGSIHGADQLGWRVLDALQVCSWTKPLQLVTCSAPIELVPMLLASNRAVIIDALIGSGPVGAIHLLGVNELPTVATQISSHGLGLIETVQLACVLGFPASALEILVLDVGHADACIEAVWVEAMVVKLNDMLAA